MEVLERVEVVEVSPWGQSQDGEFVIIASYCGDPVTDQLMREAEERVRQALKGIPAMLGISHPPSITIRPMHVAGVSLGLRSEEEYGEAIAITPWSTHDGCAYMQTPDNIRYVVVHELAHWLVKHAGYKGPTAHGPVFTATLAALYMRLGDPWSIQGISLYDIGFDSESSFMHPTWWDALGNVGWAIWIPRVLREGKRYAKTDWPASRIAAALVARYKRWNRDNDMRIKILDLINNRAGDLLVIDAYEIQERKLRKSLNAAQAGARAMKSELGFLRKYAAISTFICMLALLVAHS